VVRKTKERGNGEAGSKGAREREKQRPERPGAVDRGSWTVAWERGMGKTRGEGARNSQWPIASSQ